MTIQDLTAALIRSLTVGLLFTIAPPLVWAQVEEPATSSYINFRIQTLKPGKAAEWEQLRKEQRDGHRKAGTAFYHVYESLRGPWDTRLIIQPATAIGEPGAPIAAPVEASVAESWYNAISGTLDSQLVVTLEIDSGLRTLADGPGYPSNKFAHVRIRTAAPGRSGDFEAWLRNDLIPGLRKADVGDVRIGRVVLGGSPRTWVTFSFVDGWPYSNDYTVDQRMLAKGDAMVASWIDYFYEFRDDLSYSME